MLRVLAGSAVVLLAVACSSTSTNSDPGTGGSAGVPASGGAGGAAGLGGTTGDGAAGTPPTTFCTATKAALCADFELDGVNQLLVAGKAGSFASPFKQGGGEVSLIAGHLSSTAAALAVPPLSPTSGEAHIALKALSPVSGGSMVYEADVRVDLADAEGPQHAGVAIGGIELGAGANPYKAQIYLDAWNTEKKLPIYFAEVGTGVLTGGTGYEFRPVHPTAPVHIDSKQWVRVFLTLELPADASNQATATVEIQQEAQPRAPVLTTTIKAPKGIAPTMNLGLVGVAPFVDQGAWSVVFDNATLVVK